MRPRSKAINVIDRFEVAVETLATGPGDIRSRLLSAFISIMVFRDGDLPDEVRKDFAWVVDTLTKKEAQYPGEGRLHSTLRQMRNSTGSTVAHKIFGIYKRLLFLSQDGAT